MNINESDLNLYKPPTLLWHLIEEECPHGESIEIKNLLGNFLVEQTVELHEELSSLMEIWSMCNGVIGRQAAKLRTPVAAKELLLSEIRYFVENIRKKATQFGRNSEDYLDFNSYAIRYATNSASSSGISSRCSSHLSTNPLQSFRTDSSLSVERISLSGVENMIEHFKGILEEEVDMLISHIQHIRESLENNFQPEPSLNDLKTERENLSRVDEELNQFASSGSISPEFSLNNSRKIIDTFTEQSKTLLVSNPITTQNKTMMQAITKPNQTIVHPITTQNQLLIAQPVTTENQTFGKQNLKAQSNDVLVLNIKHENNISTNNNPTNIDNILPLGNNARHKIATDLKTLQQPLAHSQNQTNKKLTASKTCKVSKIVAPAFSMTHVTIQTKRPPVHVVKETNSDFQVHHQINNNVVGKSTSVQRFRTMVQDCRQIK